MPDRGDFGLHGAESGLSYVNFEAFKLLVGRQTVEVAGQHDHGTAQHAQPSSAYALQPVLNDGVQHRLVDRGTLVFAEHARCFGERSRFFQEGRPSFFVPIALPQGGEAFLPGFRDRCLPDGVVDVHRRVALAG